MPVEIPLTRGFVALVDEADAEFILAGTWRASQHKNGKTYAVTSSRPNLTVYMHRLILGYHRGDSGRVDHRDHNGLNNQRQNLRPCTQSQNIQFQRIPIRQAKNQHGYHGVMASWGQYRGRVCVRGHDIYTAAFDTPFEAAVARDQLAIEHYGEFASLNFHELRDAG